MDTGNYYAAHDGRIDAIENGVATASGLRKCSARPVVKAFNNIVAATLDSRGAPAVGQAASVSQWPVMIRESARRRSGEEATQIRPTRGLTLDK